MKLGAPRQQHGFWDVASKARNRKSAALPANVPLRTAYRGEAPRVRAAGVVHADRSAVTRRPALFAGKIPAKKA